MECENRFDLCLEDRFVISKKLIGKTVLVIVFEANRMDIMQLLKSL